VDTLKGTAAKVSWSKATCKRTSVSEGGVSDGFAGRGGAEPQCYKRTSVSEGGVSDGFAGRGGAEPQ
jgi:hypothetical protein